MARHENCFQLRTSRIVALTTAAMFVLTPLVARAADDSTEQARVKASGEVLTELINSPSGIPHSVLNKSECIIILPSVKEGRLHCGCAVRTRNHELPIGREVRWPVERSDPDAVQRRQLRTAGRWRGDGLRHPGNERQRCACSAEGQGKAGRRCINRGGSSGTIGRSFYERCDERGDALLLARTWSVWRRVALGLDPCARWRSKREAVWEEGKWHGDLFRRRTCTPGRGRFACDASV